MTSSWPECTKTPPKTGEISYFLIEKEPKTAFLDIKLLTRYNSNTFCKE
jgi:hypothetical protein